MRVRCLWWWSISVGASEETRLAIAEKEEGTVVATRVAGGKCPGGYDLTSCSPRLKGRSIQAMRCRNCFHLMCIKSRQICLSIKYFIKLFFVLPNLFLSPWGGTCSNDHDSNCHWTRDLTAISTEPRLDRVTQMARHSCDPLRLQLSPTYYYTYFIIVVHHTIKSMRSMSISNARWFRVSTSSRFASQNSSNWYGNGACDGDDFPVPGSCAFRCWREDMEFKSQTVGPGPRTQALGSYGMVSGMA